VRALGQNVAIDGKSLRGSAAGGQSPVHMVSAFATELGIVLGQEKVADKSNEITAIPALLESLAIQGCLVSIDAMGTQRQIARAIRDMGADYLLAVKGNQPSLHEALKGAFVGQRDELHNAVQAGHGRHVFQIYRTLPNTGEVDTALWADCAMLGRVDSLRIVEGKTSLVETRYYISSRTLSTADFAAAVRDHWGIENRLHWSLDVIFAEDARRLTEDNAPQNFSLLTKIALNLLRQQPPERKKKSLRLRRKRIGWDDDARMTLLGFSPL
jgi:predicted transposase YbfD/YdcC